MVPSTSPRRRRPVADPAGFHKWAVTCRCCGIEKRTRIVRDGFELTEFLVDGVWTTKRPDCRAVAADRESLP